MEETAIEDYFRQATSLSLMDQEEEAIELFDKVLEIDPNFCPALAAKGFSLHRLGKHGKAMKCFIKASKIDPSFQLSEIGIKASATSLEIERLDAETTQLKNQAMEGLKSLISENEQLREENARLKEKYLLFAGENGNFFGGWNDLQGIFDSVEEAEAQIRVDESGHSRFIIEREYQDWYHIVNTRSLDVVKKSEN